MHFKAPEIIFAQRNYDYKVDVWSFGCIFASLLFRQDPFFPSAHAKDHIKLLIKVLGKKQVEDFVNKRYLSDRYNMSEYENNEPMSLKTFFNDKNKHLMDDQALDLLSGLLR